MAAKKATRARKTTKAARPRATKAAGMDALEASAVVKRHAAKQRIDVRLTQEQLDAILGGWKGDPRLPAEIVFRVGRRPGIKLQVAAYRYAGDTCCV